MNTFDKVIGYKSIKQELQQICDMIRNRTVYEEMGARLPHGLLLYGDPGLGKTLLAKCLIEESGLNAITIRRDRGGDAFISSIMEAFAKAKADAPAIIFLDDMDKFSTEDASYRDTPEYAAVQAGIDDIKESNVFLIATANEIRKLPISLRRSGRFDRKLHIQAPTASDAEAIIAHYIKGKRLSDDVNIKDLAMMMRYQSCAELETILNEAAVRAAFCRQSCIQMKDMVSAVLKQQYDTYEDIPCVSDEVMKYVALHEAGHLVVAETLCPGSVGFVSLLPSEENRCGGFVHRCKTLPAYEETIIVLSGKAAVEMRHAGQTADGCSTDIEQAVSSIRDAIAKKGTMGFSFLDIENNTSCDISKSLQLRSETAIQIELERCYDIAKRILAQNETFLNKVTEALLEKKSLLYSDIRGIRSSTVKSHVAVTHEASSQCYQLQEEEALPTDDPAAEHKQRIIRKIEEYRKNSTTK